ncbi:hypothetical protein [Pseudomonas yamanorum]|uniref:Uncharacterized protein n=1 Tax=Pseudomonas yamanorum TaxID=515393 RepID=A0A7Y8EIV4_9PSED|nr:hypothetical protein [Pseudomonas yamanorum]NWE15416.1 hypothetical protein [Pseudomonas yamanorum]
MDIPSKHVFEALSDKGVDKLHHSNSVATACQFLRSKSLLSRGTVERIGITQTPQASDDLDRRYSIWFDVFMDSVDIHSRARRANVYGPVLFVFDISLIDRNGTGRLWLTKLNPTKWSGKAEAKRWFQDKKDIEANFVFGQFDQMLVARHCGGELPFGSHLKKIVLDDPNYENNDGIDAYSMAVGALRLAMQDAGLNIPIERRACRQGCACRQYWKSDRKKLRLMFDPKI